MDTISIEASAKTCADALSTAGGIYSALEPIDSPFGAGDYNHACWQIGLATCKDEALHLRIRPQPIRSSTSHVGWHSYYCQTANVPRQLCFPIFNAGAKSCVATEAVIPISAAVIFASELAASKRRTILSSRVVHPRQEQSRANDVIKVCIASSGASAKLIRDRERVHER